MIYKITVISQTDMGLLSSTYSVNSFSDVSSTRSNGVCYASSKRTCYTRCQWHSGTSYKILEENGY